MNENTGLFLVALLFGILIAMFSFYVGYESGFDDCLIEMKDTLRMRYTNID